MTDSDSGVREQLAAIIAPCVGMDDLHAADIARTLAAAGVTLPHPPPPVIDAAHLERQRRWSRATFGPGTRLGGVLDHIRKELVEIEQAPTDLSEWIDVVILAFDGAWRAGHEPQAVLDAVVAKQARNEAREWPDWRGLPEDRAIEHVRGAGPLVQPPATPETPFAKMVAALVESDRCYDNGWAGEDDTSVRADQPLVAAWSPNEIVALLAPLAAGFVGVHPPPAPANACKSALGHCWTLVDPKRCVRCGARQAGAGAAGTPTPPDATGTK